MFGTLKPHLCVLQDPQRLRYDRFYCGLCKGLGEHFGQVTRATLTHDAVFMAMLADALAAAPAEHSSCRCPIAPVIHRPTVSHESVAIRYASAVQMLLGDQWLADRAADGRRGFAAARAALGERVARARAALEAVGVDPSPLVGVEDRQSRCEEAEGVGPCASSEPTAQALGYVFSTLADLAGVDEAARSSATRDTLRSLGESVGRAIYLRDALEDLRDDLLGGAFNPCLVRDAGGAVRVSPDRVEEASARLRGDLAALPGLLDALPLQRHRDLLRNVLCDGFTSGGRRAIEEGRRVSDEAVRAVYESAAMHPWHMRAAARAALAVLALWVWLTQSATAFAQRLDTGRHHHGRHGLKDAGVQQMLDGGASLDGGAAFDGDQFSAYDAAVAQVQQPDYNPPIPHGTGSRPVSGSGDRAANWCCHELGVDACCDRNFKAICCCKFDQCGCGDCFKPCGHDCASACNGCTRPCSGCSNPCSGCSNPCSGCSNPCSGCSNPCSGCTCPCSGGNCPCSGCNDCGHGCNGCCH